jgi:hypothetical protein
LQLLEVAKAGAAAMAINATAITAVRICWKR